MQLFVEYHKIPEALTITQLSLVIHVKDATYPTTVEWDGNLQNLQQKTLSKVFLKLFIGFPFPDLLKFEMCFNVMEPHLHN